MKAHVIRHSGFTLTELLVAIGLIVVLMLAVNLIFTKTADTIGSGQALSAGMRDLRSVQTIIKKDLDGAAISDGPFFMIRSSVQATFKNQKDQLADLDGNVMTVDLTGAGEVPVTVTDYGTRTFRTDMLGFFSRGLFQRQTGNDGVFAAPMTSNEAYVWYGHLWLPTNNDPTNYNNWFVDLTATSPLGTNMTYPGWGTAQNNPNNFYSSQWVLGRQDSLLVKPVFDGTNYVINDANGVAQYYIGRDPAALATALSPLSQSSQATVTGLSGSFAGNRLIQQSRFDLAGTTIYGYRRILADAISGGLPTWWDDDHFGHRYQANPFPTRPLTSFSAAQTSPMFVPNCSQFVVEFAGDFVTQDPVTGFPTGTSADGLGELDWVVVGLKGFWNGTTQYVPGDLVWDPAVGPTLYRCILTNTSQQPPNATYWTAATAATPPVRAIRWYGLPRGVTGSGRVELFQDVVPVRDMLGVQQPFERGALPAQLADYSAGVGMPIGSQYICAWGPDLAPTVPKPRMIRILIKPEDPNGKIDLPWQEMIFNLP